VLVRDEVDDCEAPWDQDADAEARASPSPAVTDGSEDVDCVAAALLGAEDAEAVTD
jgi:hypothetical protein